MRKAIIRYLVENFDDLYLLDLKWARLLGAPAPHTLSSYACLKAPTSLFWRLFKKITDGLAKLLLKQNNHCCTDLRRVQKGQKAVPWNK